MAYNTISISKYLTEWTHQSGFSTFGSLFWALSSSFSALSTDISDSFAAEKLKVPYLSAYLDSVGTSFRYGANFATGGSSIRPGGYSPFHLAVQVSQFIQFKSRTTYLYNRLHSHSQFLIHYSMHITLLRTEQSFSFLLCEFSHVMSLTMAIMLATWR